MNDIVKVSVKYRYPWKSLQMVGDEFTIPSDNISGVKHHRQLMYAANKAAEKREEPNRYKSYKMDDGSVLVRRIA